MVARRPGLAGDIDGSSAEPIPPLWLTVPARPGQLPGLRRALRRWLRQAGVNEHDSTSVLVAVGEATSNAVEHAYVDTDTGLVRLTVRLGADDVLSLEVIDTGRWRAASSHCQHRGRGLPLMRATMEVVEVRSDQDGTTVRMRLPLSGGAVH